MKYCPNRDCPYARKHYEGQEYRDEAAICSDCGAALVSGRPVWPRRLAASRPLPLAFRLALTLVALPFASWLPRLVRLPRLAPSPLAPYGDALADSPRLSVFALGLAPIFSAFLVVELVALAVPRWRPLRHGGPEGRARLLTATWRLGLILATVQAVAMAVYMERQGILEADQRLSRLVVVLSLVAGTCVFVVYAQFLDRVALGGGFSLMAVALVVPSLVPFGDAVKWLAVAAPLNKTGVVELLAALAFTFILLQRRLPNRERLSPIRLPACGLVPLRQSAALLAMASVLVRFGMWPDALPMPGADQGAGLVLRLVLTAALAVAFSFLFNEPRRVASLDPRNPDLAPDEHFAFARRAVQRATAWSSAYVLGLALLGWALERTWGAGGLDFVPVVMLFALGLDVVGELQARRQYGELVPVWPEHRLYAVDGAVAVLESAGIPCLARSVNHRTLWHFFAPFIPIQVLVPEGRAEEASRLLHDHFFPDQKSDP